MGGQLTLTHGSHNSVITLNAPVDIPTAKAIGTALDLQITEQPEGQTCAISELAPTTVPDLNSPIFIRCVHNEVAHLTLPETLPNEPLTVNYSIRDAAYPGIPYESRPGVIGGIFPYEYRLTGFTLNGVAQSTSQVSLDFRRGTLRFTPASEGTYVVSMQIKDSGASQKTLNKNFTIQSAMSRFLFVASNGTDVTGRGGIATPYRSLTFALAQSTPNQLIVLRKGNYPVGKSDLGDTKSKQILAYPDEVALVDFTQQNSFWIKNGDSTTPVARIEGLDIANIAQYGITCDPCRSGLIVRNNRFVSGYETWSESENPSFVHGRDSGLRQNKMLVQENDFGKYTMKFTRNNFAAMVLFSAGDSIVENNQMRQNQTSSIGKGIVDKGWPDHNTHRENYIELAANQPEHDGIFLMAQDGAHNMHVHHNLLINAGIVLGGQCFQTTCPFVDNTAHHNTMVNGGVVLSWGPLNPPSSGTRVSHNIIKSATSAPYYGLSCIARPSTTDIISKLSFGSNMIESSNALALKDSECSGNDMPWAEWRGTYGMDTAASGSTLSATSALIGSGILYGLPSGDLRKTLRGHQY